MGASTLSVTERLAIQLRTGSLEQSALGLAGELLHAFGGLRGAAGASREELCRVKGIGPVKAVEICAGTRRRLRRDACALAAKRKGNKPLGGDKQAASVCSTADNAERRHE